MTKSEQPYRLRKWTTGVEGFDHVTYGGLPEGRTAVVDGSSGTGKTVLGVEFLWEGVDEDSPETFYRW